LVIGERGNDFLEVGVEIGGGGDGSKGDELLVGDTDDETPLSRVGDEAVEGGEQLLRCWERVSEFSMRGDDLDQWAAPLMPDCILEDRARPRV
jgi:hypothetical protein